MSNPAYITLNMGDDATFKADASSHDARECRVYVEEVGYIALLWLSQKAADGLIAAIQEAKERAWPAPPPVEPEPDYFMGAAGGPGVAESLEVWREAHEAPEMGEEEEG